MQVGPLWTEEEALAVLADGNALMVSLPGYVDCHLYANEVKDGLYTIWVDEEGFDEPVALLPWGEFQVMGVDLVLGNDEEAEDAAEALIEAGAIDGRERPKNVN